MYDKEDYQDLVSRQPNKHGMDPRQLAPIIKMVQSASVVMSHLMTESNAWNRYLEIMQGVQGRLLEEKIYYQSQLHNPDIWDTQELIKLKSKIQVVTGQIDLLKDAMELPTLIISGAQGAASMIKDFEEKYGKSTNTKETES